MISTEENVKSVTVGVGRAGELKIISQLILLNFYNIFFSYATGDRISVPDIQGYVLSINLFR